MNISVKFQLHPPYGFWGDDFLIFFRKFNILVAMATSPQNQSNSAVWKKIIYMLGRGLLKEHFCKTFIKYICSETTINANFHIFQYKSMIATRVVIRLEQKQIFFFFFRSPAYRCCMLQWRCRLKMLTDGWRTPAYTVSSPMSLRLRWAKIRQSHPKNWM